MLSLKVMGKNFSGKDKVPDSHAVRCKSTWLSVVLLLYSSTMLYDQMFVDTWQSNPYLAQASATKLETN